jgi:hypothetical protein
VASRTDYGVRTTRGSRRARLLAAAAISMLAVAVVAVSAMGASVTGIAVTGGAGTQVVNGVLYAKQGAPVTFTVTTSSDTKCVELTGLPRQTSDQPKTRWVFDVTAGAGDGLREITATATEKFNANNCTGSSGSSKTSYVLDNTGPVVTPTSSPLANAAGWTSADTTISWQAADAGSGVASGPTPATHAQTANTAGTTKTATATDRVGNGGSGSALVKLDKTAPTIDGTRTPAANANGWNNTNVTVSFACADGLSGIKSCSTGTTVLSAEQAGQVVGGAAKDNADNTASATVGPVNIDKTPPTLSAAPESAPNAQGWYRGPVVMHWTCDDALSGVVAADCPSDSTISGEGAGRKATASVKDRAGNQAGADSPAADIDLTAPNTGAIAPSGWNNVAVQVQLQPHDALSGVAATHYRLDGGAEQAGTEIAISDEGTHTLAFWSVDRAGNAEDAKTVEVRIDKTKPSITHLLTPAANANGWNRGARVDVEFSCDDEASGIASCGPDAVITTEGNAQDASGKAVDHAGNEAVDPATVSLDRTDPRIDAAPDRAPDANGWYRDPVTIGFSCSDALSGIDRCPAPEQLGEGADQSASGTAVDAAGNTAQGGVADLDVDTTPPTLSGAPSTAANEHGWYRDDVVIAWACDDALSGLDGSCPQDDTIAGEGVDLSASASVADRAGNRRTRTVAGINIDRTPPITRAHVEQPLASGWYAGAVRVELETAADLSTVDATYFSVDGAPAQRYAGPFDFGAKGSHELAFWSVDKAGNVEDRDAPGNAIEIKIDGIAPTITGTRDPAANDFGWSNSAVTVSFTCSDDESGVAGCSDPITLADEGADQSATGSAVDNAGNTGTATVEGISIDRTEPTLTGAATTAPNAADWYRDDVTVDWTAQDGLSGIDPGSVPADSVVGGEGDQLGTEAVSVFDKAGNEASASVTGIRIDRTPPSVTGAPRTPANGAGWHTGDVIVGFACEDALSGTASCPSDKVVSGNGAGKSVASGPATDMAGNESAGVTVGGINIDGLPPQTTADNRCTRINDWCTGSSATVVLSAADQSGLSGVKEIHYRVGGGAEVVAAGAEATVTVPLDGSGEASVRYFAVDAAGNVEPTNGVALKYDNIAPTVTHTLSPVPNAEQWNHDDVTVHFAARDDDTGSGVDADRTTPDVVVDHETPGELVVGEAYDVAGNRGTDKVTVKLDKTGPLVEATVSGPKSGSWYTGSVTVHFTCSDALSGVAVCPADKVLTENGPGQSASATATDKAGNATTASVHGIDIDGTAPSVSVGGVADGGIYTLGDVPAVGCRATDDESGVESCEVTRSGGLPSGVGTYTAKATATDKAGHVATASVTYRVIYRFDGFRQPINDTAHQVGTSTSVFKAGSTVPVKLQLKRADGTIVANAGAPAWLTPVKGGVTTAPVDESLYAAVADANTAYRSDAGDQQWMFNWGTPASGKGYYHRIGARLDDGQTYYVNIGLR